MEKQKKNKIVEWEGDYKIVSILVGEFSPPRVGLAKTVGEGDIISKDLMTGRMFYVTEVKDHKIFGYYLN